MWWLRKTKSRANTLNEKLKGHFKPNELSSLVTAIRVFPMTARVDLQKTLEKLFREVYPNHEVFGFRNQYSHEHSFAPLLTPARGPSPVMAPLQSEDVEMGEDRPVRCLTQAVWLASANDLVFGVLLSLAGGFTGRVTGVHLEIAVPPGEEGFQLSQEFFDEVEAGVNSSGSYRGKVLSLEITREFSGNASGIKVHRLTTVTREEVILPDKTLTLLENNVMNFIESRDKLKELKLSVKKGLLFYGPPGTGKTHTIHYLASQLKNHTTLLISAEQVSLLTHYMKLARFLQPAIIIIEDADLIGRDRRKMDSVIAESILNKLLNEMDGLREDAELLFILTTNRPEELEAALASRPGRIDPAIEFPLPDETGRRKLVELYTGKLVIVPELVDEIVKRTKNGSAAFIKELMRRSAQYCIQKGDGMRLNRPQLEQALDEMLFTGGSLNRKLLGVGEDPQLGFGGR